MATESLPPVRYPVKRKSDPAGPPALGFPDAVDRLLGLRQAITLWQPWAWAVAHAGKDVENRTWAPPAKAVGRLLMVHAGKRYDPAAADSIREVMGTTTNPVDSPWFVGPVGWILRDVVALPQPVPCRGRQGLWTPEDHVVAQVAAQLRLRERP